jgi:hypothetical protein
MFCSDTAILRACRPVYEILLRLICSSFFELELDESPSWLILLMKVLRIRLVVMITPIWRQLSVF